MQSWCQSLPGPSYAAYAQVAYGDGLFGTRRRCTDSRELLNRRRLAQVRPLLPGSPGCLALVTSRDHLTALAAVPSALTRRGCSGCSVCIPAPDLTVGAAASLAGTRWPGSWITACIPPHAAATLIDPRVAPTAPQLGVMLARPATTKEALSWFTTERATLAAAVPLTAEAGFPVHACQFAWALSTWGTPPWRSPRSPEQRPGAQIRWPDRQASRWSALIQTADALVPGGAVNGSG